MEKKEENMEESNNTSPEQTAGKSAQAVDLPIPEKKSSLFSADTRFGRFLRDLGRALAIVIGLVGVGALLIVLLMVRPLQQAQSGLAMSATQTASELAQRTADLEKTQKELSAANQHVQDAQTSVKNQQSGGDILQAENQLLRAQAALLEKDTQNARAYVDAAEEQLANVLETITKSDKNQADSIRALFTLIKGDIERNPALFPQDVKRLLDELDALNDKMR